MGNMRMVGLKLMLALIGNIISITIITIIVIIRLVRISPFDPQQKRHTSFAQVLVYPGITIIIAITITIILTRY
jgi:protein subunit release factor B